MVISPIANRPTMETKTYLDYSEITEQFLEYANLRQVTFQLIRFNMNYHLAMKTWVSLLFT